MIKNIFEKINLENLTKDERELVVKLLKEELEKRKKKENIRAMKMAKNEKILQAMDELLDKQGQFTASEVFDYMNGEVTIQRVSYVARDLAEVVAVDNPLYAVKVYKRP